MQDFEMRLDNGESAKIGTWLGDIPTRRLFINKE